MQILRKQQLNKFCQQLQKRDHPKNIEVLAPDTLDSILQHFFAEINKKDGKDYEPSFLAAMQSSIARYLHESNYEYSILNTRFKAPLLRKGLGKKTNKTNSLTRQEEDILWECGQLGEKTPESIAGSSHSKFWVAGETRTSLNES